MNPVLTPQKPTKAQSDAQAKAAPMLPFVQSAHEHTEIFYDGTQTPGTNATAIAPIDVPAYGYLRNILLEVTVNSAGALGTGVLHEDYPWNIFSSIALLDVNGGPIFGPMDGYSTYVANIVNAGPGAAPRIAPTYSATYTTTSFYLRIPVEISHSTALGSIANQMSNANYKLNLTVNSLANLFSSQGTATANTYRIRAYLEAWSQPNDVDMLGRAQAQAPPAVGSVQFWTAYTLPTVVGDNTWQIRRTGNLIRSITIIARNSTPVRTAGVFADPFYLNWDARQLLFHSQGVQRLLQRERLADDTNTGYDTGVFVWNWGLGDHNDQGDDQPTFWLRTAQSSRIEFKGTAATAGNVTVIINDVAAAETSPGERYDFDSDTRFKPAT